MTNIRQIANVVKDGSNLILVNVIVRSEDRETGKQLQRMISPGDTFTNVNDLYAAIKTNVNELLTSGL